MTNRPHHCFATGLLVLLLSGCAGTFPSSNSSLLRPKLPPNDDYVRSLAWEYQHQEEVQDFLLSGRFHSRDRNGKVIYYGRQPYVDLSAQYRTLEARRNKIVYDLVFVVNDYYDKYELSRYATATGAGFLGDVVTLGLDTAATAVGGAGLKTILAGISTGVGGTKIAAQRDFLQNQNIAQLVQRMRVLRGKVYEQLQKNLKQPIADYPLEAALIDVQRYFHAGTLLGAIQDIVNETGAQKLVQDAADRQDVRAKAFVEAAKTSATKAPTTSTKAKAATQPATARQLPPPNPAP